jgi:glycosyltransferase involved in cell wall biosynthesis
MPCRNESRYIRHCLDSVLNNGFPLDQLEILVVDGESEDGTPAIVEEYARRHQCVRLLRNPQRIIPAGLNVGVRAARGAVIMRMDAHATYGPGYVEKCVAALGDHDADNVGGVWVVAPTQAGAVAQAIAITLSHYFGIGDAQYRLGAKRPVEADTVPFGCYRRNVFERIGYFDENLRRGEDMDFNRRLKAAGGRIVLVPDAVCYYHPRSTLSTFFRHNFWNGIWVFYPLRYGRVAFSLRHVVPGVFVLALIASLTAGLFWRPMHVTAALVAGVYLAVSFQQGLVLAWSRRAWYLAAVLPVTFAALHLAYGLGTVAGLISVLGRRSFWRGLGEVGATVEPESVSAEQQGTAPRPRVAGGGEMVSIVMPCRNEARSIRPCLDSVLNNGYPLDRLEILVMDGDSDDATPAIVQEYQQRYPSVRLVRNPKRIVPTAMNLGIREARGQVIMRMDAHATYAQGYIEKCVVALRTSGADNVGGVWRIAPTRPGPMADAIAVTLAHPFGIGDAQYRLGAKRPTEVDTVPFGCYRRDVFERIGYFDENLRRGQDMDFNHRLRAAGGRILLVPDVVCYYHPRSTLLTFLRHNLWNGIWVFYPMRFGRVAFSLRHLVPGVFVGVVLASVLGALVWPPLWGVTAAAGAIYVLASGVTSVLVARARRAWSLVIALPLAFAALHLAYGVGTLVGLARVIGRAEFWRVIFSQAREQAPVFER